MTETQNYVKTLKNELISLLLMKLVPIFVDNDTKEGLYAIKYPQYKKDEFERLFEDWNDTHYVSNYCNKNKSYIDTDFFKSQKMYIGEVIGQILDEAEILENQIIKYTEQGFEVNGDNLQMLFKPLYNKETTLPVLQETKAKVREVKKIRHPILRIYGLRIDENTFIITGGAIKLTEDMSGHKDTEDELGKIEAVKNFLKQHEIKYQEDILNFYTNES